MMNRKIKQRIIELYTHSDKQLGVHKLQLCLLRENRINIGDGRMYRLPKTMNLPQMNTKKPFKLNLRAFASITFLGIFPVPEIYANKNIL